jgi:anti-sigma B factor antagonist
MDINVKTVEQVTVVEISGDINGTTASEAQEQILSVIQPGGKILLDMSGVGYMSSAGLRMLLSTYRQVASNNGLIVLVGVCEEIEDAMSATGFLRFFTIYDTAEAGLAALE